ncbi:MAG TPA: hypothetical protein VGR28_08815 [Candidatus Thermoplasmatota archaeon]|jgi:hypothetical protein|nr:hypothetical protein [Candidatus Thermoplasmatota archaeon]
MNQPPRRGPPPWQRRTNAQPRRKFLDVRREQHFRYDMRQALDEANVPEEQRNAIYATVFSKGSRISLDEAKDFVQQKTQEGVITPQLRDRLMVLVDRYATWR